MSKSDMPFMREIKSFVKREGRLTPGQQRALQELWPKYGLSTADGLQTFTKNTVLEIGFGDGQSLISMAKAEPTTHYIGIEVHGPGVGALLLGIEKQQLDNIKVYKEDAVEVIKTCISDDSLQRIQIYFPDPWPKKRHHKRRLVQKDFIAQIRKKLVTGGVLHLATDWQNYAEHMLEEMENLSGWKNLAGSGCYSEKPSYRPMTKFEVRGKKLGHNVWDLLYRKS